MGFGSHFPSFRGFCWGKPLRGLFGFGAQKVGILCYGGAPSTVEYFRREIRNKSGNTLETLSEQILNFQVCSVGDPQTLENKADSLPRFISECTLSFFGRAPSMKQPELVMRFLTVLGAFSQISMMETIFRDLLQNGRRFPEF